MTFGLTRLRGTQGAEGTAARVQDFGYADDGANNLAIDAKNAVLESERGSLRIPDDTRAVAAFDALYGETGTTSGTHLRSTLENHLGSATLELDENGGVIACEEYQPHGTTVFELRDGTCTTAWRQYRYAGMEREQESGLQRHGVRYHAPWLGRWCSADPAGLVDGVTPCAYARTSPRRRIDPSGPHSTRVSDANPNNPLNSPTLDSSWDGFVVPHTDHDVQSEWDAAHGVHRSRDPEPAVALAPDAARNSTAPRQRQAELQGSISDRWMAATAAPSNPCTRYELIGSSLETAYNWLPRMLYLGPFHLSSRDAVGRVQAASEEIHLAAAEAVARDAHATRNAVRTATQAELTPANRHLSRAIAESIYFEALLQKYAADNRFDAYESIAAASGRRRGAVTVLARVGGGLEAVDVVVGTTVAVREVSSASDFEGPRVTVSLVGSTTGGMVGSEAGVASGTAAGGSVAALARLSSGPAGRLTLGAAAVLDIVGGSLGSNAGRRIAGSAFDAGNRGGHAGQRIWLSPGDPLSLPDTAPS